MRAFDDIGFQLIDLSNLDVSKLDAHRVYDITREYCNKGMATSSVKAVY